MVRTSTQTHDQVKPYKERFQLQRETIAALEMEPETQHPNSRRTRLHSEWRQMSTRKGAKATETKAPEFIGAAASMHQWEDRSGGDADKDVQGEAISKDSWSDGRRR